MFSIFKNTHPATAVEHSLYCHFFSHSEYSLVVAGANILRVFHLIPDIDYKRDEKMLDSKPPKTKLECLATFSLFGNVMSLQAVTLAGSQRDAILLSFKDAKMSVVEYDPATHDLKTLSLHYFEEDEMKAGWTQHHHIPHVRVDPEGRCAVMLVYGRKLVILPFRRDLTTDESELMLGGTKMSSGRSHVMSSYTINLSDLEERMDNIIDLQFLPGYYEPTLLLLYEPIKTFPGRIAVRQDTCAMVAISLNIQQKVHPIIWSVSNLPFDCIKAFPVPKPIGGTLIFAVNSLMYLNQSVPPYGVSLNHIAETSTNFPLKIQEGVKLSLDCAQAAFISSDRLVISLKGGELYVLTLFADSMRSVRSFHFDKAAASVLTTCMSVCEDSYLFLGSRLGNSLLLRFIEKEGDTVQSQSLKKGPEEEPPSKKKRLDTLGDWMASDVSDIRDQDELEVYGNEDQTSMPITAYAFEVCDSLLNIGPCGNVSMGEPAFLSEEFSNMVDPDVELVTTSGYGKNGALCVLQRSLRPQVVTTFELPGVVDMWTVTGPSSGRGDNSAVNNEEGDTDADGDKGDLANSHAFMILSQDDSSMILQTGHEINELDHSGFNTQGPTVYAGNIGNNRYIVQVSPAGVRLLHGSQQIQHIPLDMGSPIIHASVADPHMIILSDDGQVMLLTFKDSLGSGRLSVSKPSLHQRSKLLTLCSYCDVSGIFTTAGSVVMQEEPEKSSFIYRKTVDDIQKELDDEDELLYGDSEMSIFDSVSKSEPVDTSSDKKKSKPRWQKYLQDIKPTYWMIVARGNGSLEFYTLPDFKLSYVVKNFPLGSRVLVDSIRGGTTTSSLADQKPPDHLSQVHELLLVGLGHCSGRPLLLARVEDELLMYEAFPFFENLAEDQLKMRFKKIAHNLILKEKRSSRSRKKMFEAEQPLQEQKGKRLVQLRYFSNIAGYNGVFICGSYPHWLFMTSRGELRTHPMGIDGVISCFAPFHNINCPQGFLYFNKKSELRICVLPTHLSYDAHWPVRKVPLRCTPHFVTYHLESKTYCVVTSTSETTSEIWKFNGDDKELSLEERDDRFLFPSVDKFALQLFSPVSWEAIPNTRIELDKWEHATCLKYVSLLSEGAHSGMRGYIVVGSNHNYGEDVTSRGKIYIIDIIEVVPEPGQPLTKNKIKMIYSKEQKGPITAIGHVAGFLMSAVGQKIYIWQLKDKDLIGIAFIDTQIYIHQMLSVKNFILIADVYKSISLLRFQEDFRTLSLISRDFRPLEVYAIEYLVDNSQLGFLVSDVDKNLSLYMYQPEARESYGGQRLIRKADIHIGQHVNSFFRIRCKLKDPSLDKKNPSSVERRHITMFATLDGGLGFLLPIAEKTYRRLLMLQNVLMTHIPHAAGLNPKGFRTYCGQLKHLSNPARGVIDGELVWKFLSLPVLEKQELSKKIGTKVDEIVEDMMEIDRYTAHF